MTPTNGPIYKGNRAARENDPAQGPTITKEGSGVDGQTHEDVPDAVNGHKAINHPFVGGCSWWFEFKEGEGIAGANDGVDAESHEDGCDYVGGDAERGRLGECSGGHCNSCLVCVCMFFLCRYESCGEVSNGLLKLIK